ncbi:SDR family NAD(P)-dependent oxidoreductase [Streptomyces sp. NPDC020983]|uniref:SDR family NAD(P)-dependent oxidoreductase n=1 Tax=Streptomyces sp. NPDC020983 TaxID=3365106 RepID=UPI0037B49E58
MKPVCLITGAGGRLGQLLCADLAQDHEVVATYHTAVPRVASQLQWPIGDDPSGEERSPAIHCVQADLLSREDIRRVVEVAHARHGRIDSIVNAAADVRFHGRLVELWESGDEIVSQLAINAVAPAQLASAVFQSCWKDQTEENSRWNRSIVNVSSISGLSVSKDVGQAYYAASKAALNTLTMYLSLELAPYSVRANAICPARFANKAETQRVVDGVRQLIRGRDTGLLVSRVPA